MRPGNYTVTGDLSSLEPFKNRITDAIHNVKGVKPKMIHFEACLNSTDELSVRRGETHEPVSCVFDIENILFLEDQIYVSGYLVDEDRRTYVQIELTNDAIKFDIY